ncbi:unnamed protein product [Oikopleura dioica]|uniref:Uncharacterized protein n=1 Tax=Oikopleura dioica TaxID=34765 RepID=E4X2C1_OIKDI|nr:unnamed protein product [Oikopleura dioica]
MSEPNDFAIGIDLGTTNTVFAVYRHNNAEVLQNSEGDRLTKSCVMYTAGGVLVGNIAFERKNSSSDDVILLSKRYMGRSPKDDEVEIDNLHLPWQQPINENGKLKFPVKERGKKRNFSPEEVASEILRKVRFVIYSEKALGIKGITKAVISVPAYFNAKRIQATKDAAVIAGFEVLQIAHEPIAAAIAYGQKEKLIPGSKILVYDLGGGTFDATVIEVKKKMSFKVLAVAGDSHLGGENFNHRITNKLVLELNRRDRVKLDMARDEFKSDRLFLRDAVEGAKRTLTAQREKQLSFQIGSHVYDEKLSRAKFENFCVDLFKQTIDIMSNAIKKAKLTKNQIDRVVIVGGSTRIPKIRAMLKEFFPEKTKHDYSVNVDEAVAMGCAILAAKRNGNQVLRDLTLVDINPFTFGVRVEEKNDAEAFVTKLIEKGSAIPSPVVKQQFFTYDESQTEVVIPIYQIEDMAEQDQKKEVKITEFTIKCKRGPKEQPKVEGTVKCHNYVPHNYVVFGENPKKF